MWAAKTDQTGQMLRLIFDGCTSHFVGFVMRWLIFEYELEHRKAYKMIFAANEDSNLSAHPHSLIRVLAVWSLATDTAQSRDWSDSVVLQVFRWCTCHFVDFAVIWLSFKSWKSDLKHYCKQVALHTDLLHFIFCNMGFIQFWINVVDKEIKVHRRVIQMIFPMIQVTQ